MLLFFITMLLLFTLAIGLPVALSLCIAGSVGLLAFGGFDLLTGILVSAPASAVGSYEFLTIPMFLLMAEFMVASGISNSQKTNRLMIVGVHVSPAPLNACVSTMPHA